MIVDKEEEGNVKKLLQNKNVSSYDERSNLQKQISYELEANEIAKSMAEKKGTKPLNYFATFEEIEKWVTKLAKDYPTRVRVKSMGKTYQNRPHLVVEIGKLEETWQKKPKKWVLLESGIHAREWLATASNVYIMNQVLTKCEEEETIKELLKHYCFSFILVANPDGYVYTFEKNDEKIMIGTEMLPNRFWRKTMRPYGKCTGADPNRNFDADFNSIKNNDTCSDIYPGPHAFSENITQNIANYLIEMKKSEKIFSMSYSIHAFGKMWLMPGGTKKLMVKDYKWAAELTAIEKVGVAKLKEMGSGVWDAGTPPQLIYPVSGSTMDYYRTKIGIRFPMALEVAPSMKESDGRGISGFLADPSDIATSGEELYQVLLATLLKAKELGY